MLLSETPILRNSLFRTRVEHGDAIVVLGEPVVISRSLISRAKAWAERNLTGAFSQSKDENNQIIFSFADSDDASRFTSWWRITILGADK